MKIRKYVLDANCFIDAVNTSSPSHELVIKIFQKAEAGEIEIAVSEHTLAALRIKPDAALTLANSCEKIPQWSSTDENIEDHEAIQEGLAELSEKRINACDKAAFIDALYADCYAFITSDRELSGDRARKEMKDYFVLKVLRPQQLNF